MLIFLHLTKNFITLTTHIINNFKLVGSAHNLKEIKIKELQKVDKIFLSSLFKKNKNYLGINKFKALIQINKKKNCCFGGYIKKK